MELSVFVASHQLQDGRQTLRVGDEVVWGLVFHEARWWELEPREWQQELGLRAI